MTYVYAGPDPSCRAYSPRLSEKRDALLWECSRGADTLVLETPFGGSATTLFPALCAELESVDIRKEKFAEIRPGVWARYVSAGAKARMNGGCPLHREACTYTVLACETDGDVCTVHAPAENRMSLPSLDVPLQIHVEVYPVTKHVFLKPQPVFTGFFGIELPGPNAGVPGDGTLAYTVGGIRVPVTDEMLAQGTVYVKSDTEPRVISANPGLKLN